MASSKLLALLGLLAVAGYQNRDRLGSMLEGITGPRRSDSPTGDRNSDGGLLGGLGGLFGAGAGTAGQPGISGTLSDLLNSFTGKGHGDVAKSWVDTGDNRQPSPDQLEDALGSDSIEALTRQTGLSKAELLERLRAVLPVAVDKLTPDGRLPADADASRWFATQA